ncbi:MAG: hypothetical protein JNL13_07560 [Chitinophagaceae bacterium]|nr:hypothetical protein [Chitinophagaceae bacterium]
MKKLLNTGLLLSSLIGYLEWGTDQRSFLFQVECTLFFQPACDSLGHPFILLPLIGQALLLITLFQKTPSRYLSLIGLALLSLIMLFLFVIGIMSGNVLIAGSTLPFIACGIFVLRAHRKRAGTATL